MLCTDAGLDGKSGIEGESCFIGSLWGFGRGAILEVVWPHGVFSILRACLHKKGSFWGRRFYSVLCVSIRFDSIVFDSIRFYSVLFYSTLFVSIRFDSILSEAILFDLILFESIL